MTQYYKIEIYINNKKCLIFFLINNIKLYCLLNKLFSFIIFILNKSIYEIIQI